ncbi:hypothetical protein ANAPC1_00283 [Anaplasma phagocytophilum]|uniref:Uncharacterized protein n=1 Tax=Anaplasma phagocytophilum TaxID=948 RepID=A0AA45US73_ANAPH|nr:hypothetical protein ANAPC1_00283 [Anaplasma phagocytophilum]
MFLAKLAQVLFSPVQAQKQLWLRLIRNTVTVKELIISMTSFVQYIACNHASTISASTICHQHCIAKSLRNSESGHGSVVCHGVFSKTAQVLFSQVQVQNSCDWD